MSDVIVIGGGPAGITAALEGAAAGADVTLVAAEPVGGRATWASLLPSKVLLTAADHLEQARRNPDLGLPGPPPDADLGRLRARIVALARARSARDQDRLRAAGVRLVAGRARFVDGDRIEIRGDDAVELLSFDRAIVAAGSVPVFPPEVRPDGRRILAPRFAGTLGEWPAHMIVIGGGVTGAEFASFFLSTGCEVTWVTDLARMLARFDPDIGEAVVESLAARGMTVVRSQPVVAARAGEEGVVVSLAGGRRLLGTHAFLALGRKADVADLGLDAVGLEVSDRGLATDAYGRTAQPHVYAAGDAAGPPFVANRGHAQARVAARHAAGAATPPFRPECVVEAVYAHPEAAQVGLTEIAAAAAKRPVRVGRARYGDALKAELGGAAEGFVKVVADAGDGRVVGAAAVGDSAAEVLAPAAVAIAAGMTVDDLAAIFPAHPTWSELLPLAARHL